MLFDAVLLAGGRATRLGRVDKPGLDVGTLSMLDRALRAADAARAIVVVGPPRPDTAWGPRVIATQEDPPHAGPVAALDAGLRALDPASASDIVVVLATDLPEITADTVSALVRHLDDHRDLSVVVATDPEGAEQYLLAAWRRSALADALAVASEQASVRSLLPATRGTLSVPGTGDVDTAGDLAAARARLRMSVADARTAIAAAIEPQSTRSLTVRGPRPVGAVLATSLSAAQEFPSFDTAAMDGWVVSGDGPWRATDAVILAGGGAHTLSPGSAARIATGAMIPAGTSAVIRDEFVLVRGGQVSRRADATVRSDIRRRGEDWTAGEVLVPAGSALTAAVWSVALSAGVDTVEVRGPSTARVVLTGNEVREKADPAAGHIRDSIGPIAQELLRTCGFHAGRITRVAERETSGDSGFGTEFDSELADRDSDVVVVVGATGGGAADRLRHALTRHGATIVVSGIACRPGGSTVVATLPSGSVIVGLPGNPYAAVATLLTVGPAIARARSFAGPVKPVLGDVDGLAEAPVTTLIPVRRNGSRWRVQGPVRTPHLRSLIGADAVAVVPPGTVEGTPVELLMLPTL